MHVMNRNWSATKQRLHPQSVAEKSTFSFVRGQNLTMRDIVWVSPQGHRSVSVSRYFLLQAPQCPCSVRKRFSRDHCCRGRSKPEIFLIKPQKTVAFAATYQLKRVTVAILNCASFHSLCCFMNRKGKFFLNKQTMFPSE